MVVAPVQSALRMKDISDYVILYCRHATEEAAALERIERKEALRSPERRPEITFRRGSNVKFGSLRHKLRKVPGAVEEVLASAVEIEPQLIPAEPVAQLAEVSVSTVTGEAHHKARSLRSLATPSKRKSTRPRRANLRTTLVRDLRKRKRELTKELNSVKRDLKSLRAK